MTPKKPQTPYMDPIPVEEGVDPIWWITGGLTLLLVGFSVGYIVLGMFV